MGHDIIYELCRPHRVYHYLGAEPRTPTLDFVHLSTHHNIAVNQERAQKSLTTRLHHTIPSTRQENLISWPILTFFFLVKLSQGMPQPIFWHFLAPRHSCWLIISLSQLENFSLSRILNSVSQDLFPLKPKGQGPIYIRRSFCGTIRNHNI